MVHVTGVIVYTREKARERKTKWPCDLSVAVSHFHNISRPQDVLCRMGGDFRDYTGLVLRYVTCFCWRRFYQRASLIFLSYNLSTSSGDGNNEKRMASISFLGYIYEPNVWTISIYLECNGYILLLICKICIYCCRLL